MLDPFKSCKGLTSSEGFILGPDGAPLSITEAAKSIVLEARNLVQKELGLNVIEWDNENPGLTSVHLDEIHLSQFDSGLGEEKSGKNEPAINESKKRLHSENSNEQRRVKSPKLSKGEDERGKGVPPSDCKLIANPVDIIKESSCSMEKNLRSESEYASKGSVGSIDLNDSKCKTQEKTEVENLLVTNNEKLELSSRVSKAKPKGSFLFSKSSKNLQKYQS
ncbi:hypothetical protein Avbf_17866 [Armadillidium vulgare]|nr:hypothetical protein Avbf_17866 [Armadillidium vulgare]